MKSTRTRCEVCRKPATSNFQKVWEEFAITPRGRYLRRGVLPDQDPGGEDNVHVCAAHRRAWLDGTLDTKSRHLF